MELIPMLAAISGDKLVDALIMLVVWGVILWVCWWGLGKINPGEPWQKVGTVILVLLTVVVLVNIMLTLTGKQAWIKW